MSQHETMFPPRAEVIRSTSAPIPSIFKMGAAILALLGLVVFVVGLFVDPDRAWHSLQVSWLFWAVVSSAGVMFVAVQRIATARWSRSVIRLLEGYVAFLPVAFIILLLMLTAGQSHIFTWVHEAPPVEAKRIWLDPTFLVVRDLLVFGLITALSLWYVYTSVRLDVGVVPEAGARWARGLRERMRRGFGDERRELHTTHSLQGKMAVFLAILFGFGWSMLSWDLSMSMSLHFQSTMYGWQVFMGGWLAALMLFTLLTMWWQAHLNAHHMIVDHQFHDLGKLCFAFTAFWGYLTFSQYLIIWYGNMPEETHFFRHRLTQPWAPITMSAAVLVFILPFFGLISKAGKMFRPTMILFAVCSLVGLYLARFIEVYPSSFGEATTLPFGLWELGLMLGMTGLWGVCYMAFMDAFPRMRVVLMTSPYRDEVQVPCDPRTMEPLPAHE